jgi:hypothetical protein
MPNNILLKEPEVTNIYKKGKAKRLYKCLDPLFKTIHMLISDPMHMHSSLMDEPALPTLKDGWIPWKINSFLCFQMCHAARRTTSVKKGLCNFCLARPKISSIVSPGSHST